MMVRLKNINLEGVALTEQALKVCEEERELFMALREGDKANAIEEFWDVVQAYLGLLQLSSGITADDVMFNYAKHLQKIRNRPRIKAE